MNNKKWTKAEENYLKDNKDKFITRELAEQLGRGFGSVEHKLR